MSRVPLQTDRVRSVAKALLALGVVALVAWRGLWLASAVPDTTHLADVAAEAVRSLEQTSVFESTRISFASWERFPGRAGEPFSLRLLGTDVWDDEMPVWITPGRDGQPGWATWDDNGNGEIDDTGELGAAWSDDFCVVGLPGEPTPAGRILDRGGFRPLTTGAATAAAETTELSRKIRRRLAIAN